MAPLRSRALVAVALLVGVLRARPASAADGERLDYRPGLALGVRTGWGFPLGVRANVSGVPDPFGPSGNFGGMFPLWVDAGYRISKLFYVGGYFEYGFLFVPESNCPPPELTGCSAHDIRFGAAVHAHVLPRSAVDPWFGLGLGYEESTLTVHGEEQSTTRTNGGFEVANVQVGADVHSTFGVEWGPFLSFSIDEYATESQSPPTGPSKTYSLGNPTIHYFLVLGGKAQFDL